MIKILNNKFIILKYFIKNLSYFFFYVLINSKILDLNNFQGGDCNKEITEVLEGCVWDNLNGIYQNKISKCTGEYFPFRVPKDSLYIKLADKIICMQS